MKLLSSIDDSFKPSAVNEVTHNIDSDQVDAQCMEPNSSLSNQDKTAATHDLNQKLQF